MEKQSYLAYFIKREGKLSSFSITKEAFKIIIRNGRISVFITFIMFSFYALSGLADHLILEPVLTDLVAKSMLLPKNGSFTDGDPTLYKPILKDVRFFLVYLFVWLFFVCLVLMFSVAASVHSTYEAYTAKPLSLKEMLSGIRGRLKRPLITTIWMILISLASAAFLIFTIGVGGIIMEGSNALPNTVLLLGAVYYVYIFALWMVSLVVSVLEENLSGLKAIYEANELMKGKRLRAFALMMLMVLFSYTIHWIFSFLVSLIAAKKAILILAISVPKIWSYSLMKLFVFVVFTLFYHECKKSHEEKENSNLYASIAAIDQF